jgi:beta-lactamase class A
MSKSTTLSRFAFLFVLSALFFQYSTAQTGGLTNLSKAIARFDALSSGKIGVGIYHIESGQELYYNENESFPMASTFKVAIAVQLLKKVDAKSLRLDSLIAIQPTDLHPGSGTLSYLLDDPGVELSVRNLLELMLLISDNSATDMCLRLAGGPAVVTKMLQNNGITGQRIDRSTLKLIADFVGITLPENRMVSIQEFDELEKKTSAEAQKKAGEVFAKDQRDVSTPRAMTQLLLKIWKGQLLQPASNTLLLDIMYRCQTGDTRIKGMLPPDTRVAHKTGTIGATTNDVGIIELPDQAGNVIVSIFVKDATKEIPEREKIIAQVARSVYDYFLFFSPKK